jgi:hypothetical protein
MDQVDLYRSVYNNMTRAVFIMRRAAHLSREAEQTRRQAVEARASRERPHPFLRVVK